jgi:hypothetical protein
MGLEDVSIGIEATGADTTADAINKVTTAVKGLNDAPTSNLSAFATSLDNVKNSATGVNTPLSTAATGVKSLGGAYDETATKSKTLGDSFTDLGTKTGTASTNFKTFASSMVGAVGSIAGISAGIIGIVESYTQMERAQTSADRASNRYQQGLILLQTDQKKVNDLVAQGKQGTPEYAKALETLALQQDKNKTNLEFMTEAQQHASESMASFATQVVPNVISVVSNVATAIITVPKALDTMKGAFSGLSGSFSGLKSGISDMISGIKGIGPAADGATTGVKGFTTALGAIVVPAAIAAGIVAAFFLIAKAISDNGKAIHDFSTGVQADLAPLGPQVQTFAKQTVTAFQESGNFAYDAWKKFSDTIGLTKGAFKESTDITSGMIQQWRDFGTTGSAIIDGWIAKDVKYAEAHGKSVDDVIAGFKKHEDGQKTLDAAVKQSADNLKAYQDAIKQTGDSLEKDLTAHIKGLTTELTGVVPGLEKFGNAGTTIRTTLSELGKEMDAFGSKPAKTAKDFVQFGTDVNASLEKLKPSIEGLGSTVNSVFNQALTDAKAAMNGDSDAAVLLVGDLARLNTTIHDVGSGVEAMNLPIDKGSIQALADQSQTANSALGTLTNSGINPAKGSLVQFGSEVAVVGGGIKGIGTIVNGEFIPATTGMSKAVQELSDKTKAAGETETVHRDLLVALASQYINYQDAIKLTNTQLQNIIKSADDQTQQTLALTDSIAGLNAAQQQTNRLSNEQVQGYDEVVKKQLEQIDTIATLQGTLQADDDLMRDHKTALNDMKEGYLKANDEVTKWSRSLDDSIGAQKGTHDGLQTLINDYGIQFPAGIIKTNEQMKTWIGIVRGAPADIDKLNQSIDSIGNELDTTLFAAFKKGNTDFQTFLKGLPDLVKASLPPGALAAAFTSGQAQDILGQFKIALGTELHNMGNDPNIVSDLNFTMNTMLGKMQQAAANNPQLKTIFQPIFDYIFQHPPKTVEDYQKIFELLDTAVGNLKGSAEGAGLGLDKTGTSLGKVPGTADPAKTSVSSLAGALTDMYTGLKPLNDALDRLPGYFQKQFAAAGAAVESLATSSVKGFGDFLTGLKGLNDALTNMPAYFKTQFGTAGTNVGELATNAKQPLANFLSGLKGLNDALTQMPGFFKTQFTSAGTNIGALNTAAQQPLSNFTGALTQLSSAIGRMPGFFQQSFQAAGQAVNAMNTASAAAFQQMSQRIQQLMQQLQQLAQAMSQIGQRQQASYYTPYGSAGYGYTGYTPYQGVFAQHGFVGVVDKPTSFVVGEAGPEYVSVIPGGSAGTIGNSMITGLSDMVVFLSRTNTAMSSYWSASNRNTLALDNATLAANKSKQSLDNVTIAGNNNLLSTNNNTTATDNSTLALNATANAAHNTSISLLPLPPAAANTISGLIGTSGAANGTTGSLNGLTIAARSLAGAMNQILQTPGGIGGGATGGGGVGGGVQGSAGPFAGLAAQIGPGGGGAVPAVFAPYAQYGNFSGQSPAAAPGAAYYGGPPTGGGGGGGAGAFGAYAQYGNFSGSSPAPSGGASYYGGPPAQQGGGQAPSGGGQQAAPQKAQGGVMGPQGGASSPQQQPSGGASYYGGPPAGYQSSPYGAFGGYSQFGKFAASGFEGIVTQATRFIVGEAGPEHVKVTPISNIASPSTDITSIMAMIAELVRQIAGQSMNINLNSYLDGYQVYKNQQKYTNGRLGNYLG